MGNEKQREKASKYSLITGQDSYASPTAQNPETSRRISSLIPTLAGYMEREQGRVTFANGNLNGPVGWIFEADLNISGVITRYFFACSKTGPTNYVLWVCNGFGGTWVEVTIVGLLANYPTAVVIDNIVHLSDGVDKWIFDGVNWVIDGLPIPLHAPVVKPYTPTVTFTGAAFSRVNGILTVTAGGGLEWPLGASVTLSAASDTTVDGEYQTIPVTPNAGFSLGEFQVNQVGLPDSTGTVTVAFSSITVMVNKYYWTTFSDQSASHPHESSSSPRTVVGTGPIANMIPQVFQRPGTITVTAGSAAIVGVGTDFGQDDVGMKIYISSTLVGVVSFVTDAQHLTLTLPYPNTTLPGVNFVIAPVRATHINFYCSESETSNVGFLLASIPVEGSDWTKQAATGSGGIQAGAYSDQSPFAGTPGSYINTSIERPIRNDPPGPTHIMEVFANRIFRRDEQFPNFFDFTAYEEVLAFGTGDPYECVPGFDPNTISDLVDEDSMPDQSVQILTMCNFADALFIGTEKNIIPLFGNDISNFVLSQINAFSIGAGGRRSMIGSPYGLLFMSYDQKLYLWPSQWIPFYAPEQTAQLIELSRPLRTTFEQILSSDMDNIWVVWYNYGPRNWVVVQYQDTSAVYHTWVFDLETKGWFELQPTISSLAVFTPTFGNRLLVGGSTDGNVYVLDDQSGTTNLTGVNYPQGTFRTSLIDFGAPDTEHILDYVEYEVSNAALNITVNYYLDPPDPDNLPAPSGTFGTGAQLLKIGANRYRANFRQLGQGSLCKRVMLEFIIASDTNFGRLYSATLAASPSSGLAGGGKSSGT